MTYFGKWTTASTYRTEKRGVALTNAFDQIHRYVRESFNSEHSLYKYVQIFVISNGTFTKYFANTTAQNKNHFEFTCDWAWTLRIEYL